MITGVRHVAHCHVTEPSLLREAAAGFVPIDPRLSSIPKVGSHDCVPSLVDGGPPAVICL